MGLGDYLNPIVKADEEMLAKAGQGIQKGLSYVPEPVKQAGGYALEALNAPLTGWGGIAALSQGKPLSEAAEGIQKGKTIGDYLTESIPEPQSTSLPLNILGELGRSGAGLATDFGVGAIGPIELGQAAMKGAKVLGPELQAFNRELGETGAVRIGKGQSYLPPGSPERAKNLKEWFGESKVATPEREPLTVYHGAQRPDRIGETFKPNRATSGPMPFFTEDPEIASGYAKGKKDTSLEDVTDYSQWFKGRVEGFRNPVDVDRMWYFLPAEKKQQIAELAPRVTRDAETGSITMLGEPGHATGLGGYDQHLKEAKGNHLKALVEEWLNSGALYNDEQEFEKVLNLAGVDNVQMYDPHAEYSGVFPTHLSIKNPLDTSKIPPEVVDAIENAAKYRRAPKQQYGADLWDKNIRNPKEWVNTLKEDIEKGTTHAWTSIPDFVTNTLKKMGYDGIKDTGGKFHPDQHTVWIPFESAQIKSATGNRGTFSRADPNITHLAPVIAGGIGAGAAANEQNYSKGGVIPMPYEHKKTGKNQVTVTKADSGKVVGHTTPGKLNDYLAALHIHAGDKAAQGGMVEIPKNEFIREHERLLPKLSGKEKQEQEKELMDIRGYAKGGITDYDGALKKHLSERYAPKEVSYTPPMLGELGQMAHGGVVSPYPHNEQMIEETNEERHPEAEDREFMAPGGLVMPPDNFSSPAGFDVGVTQSTTTTPSFDARAGLPPELPALPSSGASGSWEPAIVPAPRSPAIAPRPQIPVDTGISQYLAEKEKQLGKYGPEEQLALSREVAQRQRGLGPNLALAGGRFADALMQGVARAGNPGFGAGIQEMQQKRGEQELGAFEKAGEQNLRQTEAQMKLDSLNPASALSKAAQMGYKELLVDKLKFSPEMVSRMSASNISDITGKSVETIKAETEGLVAMSNMGFRAQQATKEQLDQQIKAAEDTIKSEPFWSPRAQQAKKFLADVGQGRITAGTAGAGGANEEDAKAIRWARSNPGNPKAAQILKLHGLQ